jgi:hypothetical protein
VGSRNQGSLSATYKANFILLEFFRNLPCHSLKFGWVFKAPPMLALVLCLLGGKPLVGLSVTHRASFELLFTLNLLGTFCVIY